MKVLLPAVLLLAVGCCTSQKNTKIVEAPPKTLTDSPVSGGGFNVPPVKTMPIPTGGEKEKPPAVPSNDAVPSCIRSLIAQFEKEEVQNPPRKIYSYLYKGRKVYYVPPICCDFFSDLYDSDCKIIAHPDGGITGKGDGRIKDFATESSNEKLVWADKRGK